mgnify:FL=1
MKQKEKPLDLPRELRTKISGVYNMGRLGSEIRNAKSFNSSTRSRQHKNLVGGSEPKIIKAHRPSSNGLDPFMKSY